MALCSCFRCNSDIEHSYSLLDQLDLSEVLCSWEGGLRMCPFRMRSAVIDVPLSLGGSDIRVELVASQGELIIGDVTDRVLVRGI